MSDEHPTLPYPEPSSEHPTLVIPGSADEPRPTRRRARWPWVVLVIVLVLAALVVAAEFLARAILPGIVRGIVIEQLDLPQDQQLDVDAAGILLPQLIGGRLDELHLTTDAVTFGGITGAADVTRPPSFSIPGTPEPRTSRRPAFRCAAEISPRRTAPCGSIRSSSRIW